MELSAAVWRRVYVEGWSERAAARRVGLARGTVRKMLRSRQPPGYRRQKPIRCPKLEAFTGVIDQILRDDQHRPKKQRHTATRICARLRAAHAFTGGYTIVKAYVREQKLGGQELCVPRAHPPGDAQADVGEALVVIDGVDRQAHDLGVDLPHSDDAGVKAFPAETTEAFCDGHTAAVHDVGGVPRRIVYDNTTLAVARMLGDGPRQRTRVFSELQSHDLFDDRVGRPGKGNDNGTVEGLVGDARRNFFVPVPRVASGDAVNLDVANKCRARRGRRFRRHTETIGERFARDRQALFPLPPVPYDACAQRSTRVTSLALVRDRRNDYSGPTASGHRAVVVKGDVDEVVIVWGREEGARHRRSYDRDVLIFEPRHDVALLERKTGALDQAAPLVGWALPEEFLRRRRRLEARGGKPGPREYVQVLRLLEDFRLAHVRGAVRDALTLGVIGFDAVKHLTLCRIDHRPPQLDLAQYPHLPAATRGDDRGGGRPGAAGGGHRVLATSTRLLDAHLKALRLPTFLREYDNVARHCAHEGLDGPRYLFRLCELALLDREQRATERRIKAATCPVLKRLETFEFRAIPSLNKSLVLELARSAYLDRREHVLALGNAGTGKNASGAGVGAGGLSERLSGALHHRRRVGERPARGPG